MISIAFITSRKDCRLNWLIESLRPQIQPSDKITFIVTDFWNQVVDDWTTEDVESRRAWVAEVCRGLRFNHVASKPNVWSGPSRLTSTNWFSCASHRNTSICYCDTKFLAFVDDLSVADQYWLQSVREAMAGNYFVFGSYRKVNKLVVKDGIVKSYEPLLTDKGEPAGMDCRLPQVTQDVTPCDGGWCYGCSLAGPVEGFLQVGGWPEYCDSLGFEDVVLGIALKNAGLDVRFDRRMATLESDELHHVGTPFRRTDKGVSPRDKSHAALDIARNSKYFPNYYEGGIRALRDHVLAGNPFPPCAVPQHDWFDGQLIKDMT